MKTLKLRTLAIIFSASFLSSCASVQGFPDRPDDVGKSLKALKEAYSIETVLETYKNKTAAEKRAYRNEVISGRMMTIDMQYSLYQKAMYSQSVGSNVGLDVVELGLGGAGALVGGGTSQILSAVSGGIAGTQSSIDKTLFFDKTLPAILAVMNSERSTIRTRLEKGEQLSLTDYPITRALSDLETYYFAGTMPGAISQITAQAGEVQAEAEVVLERTIEAKYVNVEGQQKADELLGLVKDLDPGEAKNILLTPPSKLNQFVSTAAGLSSGSAAVVRMTDQNAEDAIRRVLVLIKDRQSEEYQAWAAAIEAKVKE